MSSRDVAYTVHPSLGGVDISSDATVLDPNFLTVADNIEFLEGGQRKKRLGTQIYSTSTANTNPTYLVSSSTPVRAVADFWRYGASLTPTQNLLSVAGKSIYGSTGDGKWTAVTTTSSFGAATNVQTVVTLAGDYAVISDESATPIAYNQTTLSGPTTGSAWPRFTASSYHLNRLFMWGISTAPSHVNYTAASNILDSTGTDAGNFPVGVGDGDRVIAGSRPFYAALYFFKGPQFGSIWQLSGSTPTDFSMVQVGYGAPAPNPRVVVTTPTDVFWLSNYGVHSLQTTVKFGNVEEAFLSLPIQKLWREDMIRRDKFDQAWAFWHPQRSVVGWAVYPAGGTQQQWILMYNYALSDSKPGGRKYWSIWKFPSFGLTCGSILLLPATWDALVGRSHVTQPAPMLGGDNGTVYINDWANQTDAGTAYSAAVRTPVITRLETPQGRVPETQEKVFTGLVTYFNPKGNYTADVTITVDRRVLSTTISLTGGGATLT